MNSFQENRTVISGTGLWCAAGAGVDQAWQAILDGKSTVFELESGLAELWPGLYFMAGRPAGHFRPHIAAAREALDQARFSNGSVLGNSTLRLGCVFGGSKGVFGTTAEGQDAFADAPESASRFSLSPSSMGDDVRADLRLVGPTSCPVAACASGIVSLIHATRWIEWGQCSSVIAGSADYSLNDLVISAYRRLGVLSNWRGAPAGACRPFDRLRSGFVIGEGAGAMLLESELSARSRGVEPLAVISGYDHRTDPKGLIDSDPDGGVIAVVVQNAIAAAGLVPADIDAICCHGTGTVANDRAEAIALRRVFERSLDHIPCFSLKGTIGHTLGASGAVETAYCVRAIQEQIVPPHRNADDVDPECPIGPLSSEPVHCRIRHLLKLSYGFGGHVTAVVLSRASLN